ncbi:unnamed protein product, partial [Cuscuta campestris]
VEEVAAGRELKGMRHSSEPDYYYEDYLMSIVRRIYSRICPKPATAFRYLSSSSRDEEGERCAGRENVPGMSRIHSTLQKLVLGGEEKVPDACLDLIRKKSKFTKIKKKGKVMKKKQSPDRPGVKWRVLYPHEKIDRVGDTEQFFMGALDI